MISQDMSATKEVDLIVLQLMRTIANAEYVLSLNAETDEEKEARKEAEKMKGVAEKELERYEPDEDAPVVLVGVIPPRIMTQLRNEIYVQNRDDREMKELGAQELNERADNSRKWLRWGIKGHRHLGIEYEAEEVAAGPLVYKAATWEMVDVYEGLGLLEQLCNEVMTFNTLDAEKKRRSLLRPGTRQKPSTAGSVATI